MENVMTVPEIAKVLVALFKESVRGIGKDFYKEIRKLEIRLPKNTMTEIAFMLYAAFDFAMSLGPELEVRRHLRSEFLSLRPLDPRLLDVLAERTVEYAEEINQTKQDDLRPLAIGKVLAKNIGFEDDSFVAMSAGRAFDILVETVAKQASVLIGRLRIH